MIHCLTDLIQLKDPATFESVFEFKNGIGPDIADSTNGENADGSSHIRRYNGR